MSITEETPAATISRTPISRRRLLQGGAAAGLTVAFSTTLVRGQDATPGAATPGIGSPEAGATPEATPVAPPSPFPSDADAYIRVNEDGTVTLMTGKVEFGQGIRTGFAQLVAEELSVPFESVQVVLGQTDIAPFDIGTFGSLSTRLTGPRIRQAGAAMRLWLLELGAESLGVGMDEVELQGGAVVVTADPSQSVGYAEIAAGKASERQLDPNAELKDPSTFTVIGQSIPRPDVAEKVNGSLTYGIDGTVEGMAWGKVVRPPSFGATLTAIDFSQAEAAPGYVGSFRDGDFAGIVAERYEQAEAIVALVQATWEELPATTTWENVHQVLLDTADEGTPLDETNVQPAMGDQILAGITQPQTFTFRNPYVNHTPIEPRNSLVQITETGANVWASTQDPFSVRSAVAETLGLEPEAVVVYPLATGGAFGAKVLPLADVEAARLAQAVGRPVKLLWRRDEEIAHGQYRPATLINITTGVDEQGTITGWIYDLYSASYFPENVEHTEDNQNGAASDWSANVHEIYELPNAQTTWFHANATLPPYYWRVNGASANTWAREVTLDILAEQSGMDPVSFRRNMLGNNPRMAAVMDAAVELAGWTPAVGQTGQGIGIALGFDAGSFVAEVAKIELDDTTGEIFVRNVYVGLDCGLTINPEAVSHQVEGSVVLGTSSALREIIKFEGGRVTNPSFQEYAPITMRESPRVELRLTGDPSQPMMGVGEPAVAPVAGAIANALYDLTGIRIYDLPYTPDRVLAELEKMRNATPAS